MSQRIWVIIPAAGIGSRMGTVVPKQYLRLAGRSVLEHSLSHFINRPDISGVVIALAAEDAYWPAINFEGKNVISPVVGGLDRSLSVRNALRFISTKAQLNDWVLVHDAARPCLRKEDLDNLLTTLIHDPLGGILGIPVSDTLKFVAGEVIDRTVDREGLWLAQTPQMFRLGALTDALDRAHSDGHQVTDEASAMEYAGYNPRIVRGHADNLKITHADDLALAEMFLKQGNR